MKVIVMYLCFGLAILLMVFSITYGVRMFSNATTPVVLVSPKQGISCATMVTSDGTAISCWKD